jgi:large subunit ribosomal protein L2
LGKRTLVRRRGKAGLQWRAPHKGKIAPVGYPLFDPSVTKVGSVQDILHERGRGAPVAKVQFEDGQVRYLPATSGLHVGSQIQIGAGATHDDGNVLPIGKVLEGTAVSNIERRFGDGGKLVRTAGTSAIVFSQTGPTTIVRFPSRKSVELDSHCRATVGIVAGGGRGEKPFLRAGARWRYMKSRNKKYPTMRGIAQAAVHHPFGGGRHQHPGKSTSTSRNAPPGRKVGHIAPRRTGRGRQARVQAVQRQ